MMLLSHLASHGQLVKGFTHGIFLISYTTAGAWEIMPWSEPALAVMKIFRTGPEVRILLK